jgi:O-antigen/teichoic acid export membrane protein
MTIRKNIFANYIGSGFVVLAPMLALPYYLHALGGSVWGLVSFIVMLQAVLALIDAGMSQALVREITLRLDSGAESKGATAAILFGFERIYWIFSVSVGCIIVLFANFIAIHWLQLGGLSAELGRQAVYGAAALFAVQFPGSVYRSFLVGAQAQVKLNGIMLSSTLLRHIGGVVIISIWPTLAAYLFWHISIVFLETLVRAKLAWRILSINRSHVGWQAAELRNSWTLIANMSSATWLGALTIQMDKILLSRMVPIEQFGYYVIAATISTGMLQLISPLTQAVLPRAIQLRSDSAALRNLNIKLVKSITFIVLLILIGFIAIGKPLLELWLRDSKVVEIVYPLLAILLVGTGLNAFYNVGYVNWLAHGHINKVFQVNLISFLVSVPLLILLISKYGLFGATFGWLFLNTIGLLISLRWLKCI